MTGPEFADPKIEQDQVPKNTVEKFGGKGAIGRAQLSRSQAFAENRVRKCSSTTPLFQRG